MSFPGKRAWNILEIGKLLDRHLVHWRSLDKVVRVSNGCGQQDHRLAVGDRAVMTTRIDFLRASEELAMHGHNL